MMEKQNQTQKTQKTQKIQKIPKVKCEPVKKLPIMHLVDMEEKNKARAAIGVSLLQVQVRRCLRCNTLFESLGNRTCGCSISSFYGD